MPETRRFSPRHEIITLEPSLTHAVRNLAATSWVTTYWVLSLVREDLPDHDDFARAVRRLEEPSASAAEAAPDVMYPEENTGSCGVSTKEPYSTLTAEPTVESSSLLLGD